MNDDEKFFAWLDGELTPAEAAEMEAKVSSDPALSRLAEQHRALGGQVKVAFDPILSAPIPDRLQAALRPSAQVVEFAAARRSGWRPSLPQWAALAATLLVGMFAGTFVPQRSNSSVAVQGSNIYAAAALNRALDTQLASAPAGEVRIGITFKTRAGDICRTFTQPATSGLACRAGDRWQIKGLFGAPEGQSSDYRMAAGMNPNLTALVDSTMAGDPLDGQQERVERDRNWR